MKNNIILLALLLLSFTFNVKSQLTTSLEEYYKFDETSGQAVDVVSGNNSISANATHGVAGKINTAFSYDGTTNMLSFADHANWTISSTGTVTISAWIYLTGDITANGYGTIWGHQSGPQFYLKYVTTGIYTMGWYTGSNETLTNGTSYSMNTWYHVVMVKNGSSITFYRNGSSMGALTASDNTINPPAVYIGSDTHTTPEAFRGRIDELGIWKRALSAAEVSQLYNSGSGLAYPFASNSAPTVTTNTTTNIAQTTVTSGGNVTSDGGASVTARGDCWSTSANPTTSNSKTTNGTGTGTFTSSITGLTAGTTYHVRAYATNSVGTSYGSDLTFTTATNPVVPAVTSNAATSITQTTATSGGNVTADGGASVTARGVCWSTSANPTTSNSKTTDGTGTGTFSSSITGLTAGTTYHIRAYATNSVGTAYGSDLTFAATSPGSGSWQTSGSNIYYNSGKVSIGTTIANSLSALTVGGKILATEVEVVSSITADDVFEPHYKLLPLPELETYLIQNKHLPGIPSAVEIAEKGQNLGEMDDLLLRKIEELTLYIIRQEKMLNNQDLEIKKLRNELHKLKKNK